MSIDTEIEGSPSSIRAAATWLSDTLQPAVEEGGDSFAAARRSAAADWRGDTGEAFASAMRRAVTQTDHVETGVTGVKNAFDDYAGSLERCQNRMTAIRDDARAGGLTVAGFTIQPPGDGPALPGEPPEAASQGAADRYNADVTAYNAHQDKIRLYNRLVERAGEVWDDIERAWERVSSKDRALDGASWTFTLTDIAGGLGGAVLDLQGSVLRGSSQYWANLSDQHLERLRNTTRVPNPAQFYDDLDHWRSTATGAADDAARAGRLLRMGKAVPLAVGGVLTGVGIWYDMEHGDESAAQAVTSNVGGFAASVATGAVVGTMIGGPVGTVVGTVVGAGVGVFTSGMIDGLWESGGDVSDAFMAGVDTLADTGDALLDGASDVGGAVVDGIGGLFD
ncbi:hypothetical protein [Nocardioides sp.]|uniref:hypothetical protein n=1 Tax=Nocardioides sp. TaxID=35761 RepID=UPI002ED2393E